MPPLLASILLAQLTANRADAWTISVRYPRFVAGGPAARAANAAASTQERREFREFSSRARREVPTLRGQVTTAKYELRVMPHRITDRPGLASGYVERYAYLAGAHGTTQYTALNYGSRGPLGLRDLFRPGVDGAAEASKALVGIMKAMKDAPSNVADGSWTHLTPQEANRFVVGRLGVLFLFDQYEVGYGAQGAPKVLVPWAKLPGVDWRGALAPLFGSE